MNLKKKSIKGVTLVEVSLVICIVGILSMMSMPDCMKYIDIAQQRACEVNCVQITRMYQGYRILKNKKHSEIVFNEFLIQHNELVCGDEGYLEYSESKVMCTRHSTVDEVGDGAPII